MIKKAVSIILTGILCLSMVSCAAPGNNPADSSAADSSEKTAAENGSAEIAAAGSSGEIAAENSSEISAGIVCNYRKDVGCPETYRDLVRVLHADICLP